MKKDKAQSEFLREKYRLFWSLLIHLVDFFHDQLFEVNFILNRIEENQKDLNEKFN